MKRFLLLPLFLVTLLSFVHRSQAQVSLFGGLTTITNTTTNSSILSTNTMVVRVGTFYISNGGIGPGTNHFSGSIQFSLDRTNYITVSPTYIPTSTNAATDTVAASTRSFPVYMRMSATTDTNLSVGAIYIAP